MEKINEKNIHHDNLLINKLSQQNNATAIKIIPEPTCAYSFSIAALFWLNALKESKEIPLEH